MILLLPNKAVITEAHAFANLTPRFLNPSKLNKNIRSGMGG